MKSSYNIGKGKENEIELRGVNCQPIHANIKYERGQWILTNLLERNPIYVNEKIVSSPTTLSKYDKITICNQTIHWSNYLYEGDKQELNIKDLFTIQGRISRSNFRALSILAIGLSICLFFIPGFLISILKHSFRRIIISENETLELIQRIAPVTYFLGFGLLGFLLLLLGIKRVRDTGNPVWHLFIPGQNIKLLYFKQSKK